MSVKKFLSLERLQEYDALIKAKIDEVAEGKADWNQNDANAIDYIKNRTHWVEQATEVIAEETTEIEWAGRYYNYKNGEPEGYDPTAATYIVTVDGVQYRCASWINLYDEYMIGDSRLQKMLDETGEEVIDNTNPEEVPFLAGFWLDDKGDPVTFGYTESWYVFYPDSETHTIKIEKLTGGTTYHTLDENFIPETIARVSDLTAITLAEIDEICGATIYSSSEVEL